MVRAIVPGIVVSVMLAGCATVNLDYSQNDTFEGYQDYAFLPPTEQVEYHTLDAQRIEAALNEGLTARGMVRVPVEQADVLVRYSVEPELRNENSGVVYGFGFGRSPVGVGVMSAPDNYVIKEGKLVVEFVRPDERNAIWRAASRRYLNEDMGPARREALIRRIVADMLAQWPPE